MEINKNFKATILMTLIYAGLYTIDTPTPIIIHYLFLAGCFVVLILWICLIALYLLENK